MGQPDVAPAARAIREWQFCQLRSLIAHARDNSPFYRKHLAGIRPESVRKPEDLARLPMIQPDILREHPERLLCVSQDEIARVVTLNSSGTTGLPKRIFNTAEDLEYITDYFSHGMSSLVEPGDTVFVLMPGERPGGVGRLLSESLKHLDVRCVAHGPVENARESLEELLKEDSRCIVGPAAHVNTLACAWEQQGLSNDRIRSVLLCWDAIPDSVVSRTSRAFGCRVFRHWGMIETGLGGAVECAPGAGMHVREADLYLEIVDPDTGNPLPDGMVGELVVTTLSRKGMPLIRYRTGDQGRMLPGMCSCGSGLRRLDSSLRRCDDTLRLGGNALTIGILSEALYAIPNLADFSAAYETGEKVSLYLTVCGSGTGLEEQTRKALLSTSTIEQAVGNGLLQLHVSLKQGIGPAVKGLEKRRLKKLEPVI